MSWIKKTSHKIRKSALRLAHGKVHLTHNLRGDYDGSWSRKVWRFFYPKSMRDTRKRMTFGHLKRSHIIGWRHLFGSSHSAYTLGGYYGSAPGNGYVYQGRSIGDMM